MNKLPQHKASQYTDFGVLLRRIGLSENNPAPIAYAHQDDYYIFGLVEHGGGCGIIDFKELHLSSGDVFLIQPGQVHRFIISESAEGWLLFADSSFVGEAEKCMTASLLANRMESITDKLAKATARRAG